MDSRRPADLPAILVMAAICMIWALQPVGLKATAELAPPLLQIGLRSGLAAVCVWLFSLLTGGTNGFTRQTLIPGVIAGVLFSLEFLLVGESLKLTTASHVVVFLYTAPIFAALGLHVTNASERLSIPQWLGILLATVGIAIAFLQPEDPGAGARASLLGDGLALAGGASWGMTTVVVRSTALSKQPASDVLLYQLGIAFLLLTGMALATGQTHVVPAKPLFINLAFQALMVSFLSFLVWFFLLKRYVASQLGVLSLLTPLFGVALGVVFLDEPVTFQFVAGAGTVLLGIVIVIAHPWWSKRQAVAKHSAHLRPCE